MKVSFPHMGTSHIAFKYLMNNLGLEAVDPPKPSDETLTLGSQHAPEFACIPFKVLLGSYLQALEKGARLLITSGGVGPCRAGLYGMLHEKILKDLGYDVEMVVFDPPLTGMRAFMGKINTIRKYGGVSWPKLVQEIARAWQKLLVLDEIEIAASQTRPYELVKGATTKVFDRALELVDEAQTPEDIKDAQQTAKKLFQEIEQDQSRNPLKVGLIGEIYVVLEPFMNMDVEKKLGELGVLTNRSIYLTAWTRDNVWTGTGEHDVKKAAQPYLNQPIGGHGVNSVGETVLYAKNNFDGVIQLAPFSCIPEIVAKSILPRVSKDKGIPVMSLTIDEQTGQAGVQTRLEAFVDLLWQRRQFKEGQSNGWLFGN